MTYKLYKTTDGVAAAVKTNEDGSMISFIFNPDNTDYQTFKKDLANGVALSDAQGTAMTADQIKTFLEILP
jgi:hypothetical protein